MVVREILVNKFDNLFWISYVARVFDLLLEDIGKLSLYKDVIRTDDYYTHVQSYHLTSRVAET